METSGVPHKLQWAELAYRKTDHTWFRDYDVHNVLLYSGIKKSNKVTGNELFQTDVETIKKAIKAVKEGKNAIDEQVPFTTAAVKIKLRPEQKEVVAKTKKAFKGKKGSNMLWNAKMRFGKTVTVLELIKEAKYQKVLIMTHRLVVNDSWFDDFNKMKMMDASYLYVSKNKGESIENLNKGAKPFVYFASIQDLQRSKIFGGKAGYKNELIADIDWDLIIIDEAHEETQTELAQNVLKGIRKNNTNLLELSGTSFNILDQYEEDNPYAELPKVSMYTFEMNKIANSATFINPENNAFNFKEFFKVNPDGKFKYADKVRQFLDNIITQIVRLIIPSQPQNFVIIYGIHYGFYQV